MTNPYNQFGTDYTKVIALYPGAATSDFTDQATVDAALNRAVREIAAALSQNAFRNVTEPDLELVERRASAGQTTVTLGYNTITSGAWPLVSGKVHIWTGPPQSFAPRPILATDPYGAQRYINSSGAAGWIYGPMIEIAANLFTVNTTTGVVTLTNALSSDNLVYASYTVDVNAAAYSVPSLGEIAVLGAGAELGGRLFSAANQEWSLVTDYRTRYTNWLDLMRKGEWIPDELRFMRWWKEVAPVDEQAPASVRLFRG